MSIFQARIIDFLQILRSRKVSYFKQGNLVEVFKPQRSRKISFVKKGRIETDLKSK